MRLPAYSRTAALLHWLHAALVLALIALGLTMVDLPKGSGRSAAYGLHKSLGLVALVLVAARLAWRRHCPPPSHPGLTGTEVRLAEAAHRLLYLLLVLAPLTGFAAVCFTPYPLALFGLPLPKPGWPDPGLNAFFGLCHRVSLAGLGFLLAIHLAAVVRHLWRRDGTLGRMLPFGASPRRHRVPPAIPAKL